MPEALTTEQIFSWTGNKPRVLAVKANGGSVQLLKPVGNDWVIADTFTTDGAWPIEVGNGNYMVRPFGGAAYEIS